MWKERINSTFFVTHSHTQVQRTTNIELSYKELTFFVSAMKVEKCYTMYRIELAKISRNTGINIGNLCNV